MNNTKGRWLTLLLQTIITSATGFNYIITVFWGPLNEKYGWAAATVIFAFTLSMWIGTPANILGGMLRDRFGCRKCILGAGTLYGLSVILSGIVSNVWFFILLQGIVAPTCMFIIYIASLANIGVLFPDRRGFAMGLYVGGYSIGGAALAPIADFLIRHFSVSFSIVSEGIAYGLLIVILAFFIVDPDEPIIFHSNSGNGEASHDRPQVHWTQMIRMPSFYLALLTFFVAGIIGFVVRSNGAMVAESAVGATPQLAALTVSLISIGAGAGGLVFGTLSDKINVTSSLLALMVVQALACITFLLFGMNNTAVFIAVIMLIGLASGGCGTLFPVMTMNTYGERFFGINMGLMSIHTIFSTFVGPQLSVRCDITTVFIIGLITTLGAMGLLMITHKSIAKMHASWDPKDEIIM